jgi:hypothetical protein
MRKVIAIEQIAVRITDCHRFHGLGLTPPAAQATLSINVEGE